MNAKASAKKTLRNFLCKQHILWSNIFFLTNLSFYSADTRMEKHQSESKHFSLDQLIKKPWFVQMHYGDFKSNLSWKHESINKNGFFSEEAWKNPHN